MIDVYTWPTPNGHKVHIALEELELPYEVHPVNIGRGEQFETAFLEKSPNNKIPAIVDRDGPGGRPMSLFESGAILIYLAEKTGRLLPADPRGRYETLAWLMFQMGSVGPMLGQAHHFRQYAPETIDYAVDRYTNEAARLYRVIDHRLDGRAWLAGDAYSIADIAVFPWLRPHKRQGQDLADYPNLAGWMDRIAGRPAVARGLEVLSDQAHRKMDDAAKETLFGKGQWAKR